MRTQIVMHFRKKRLLFVYSIIISLSFSFIFVLFLINYHQREENYYNNSIDELNLEKNSVLNSYELFSNYIFEEIINTDYILDILDEAYESDEDTKDILRTELYDHLSTEYDHMTEYDFRQVQFFFPDSVSFLRVHNLDKYGDSLYDVRYSVRTANDEHVYITGFEEGRTYNG